MAWFQADVWRVTNRVLLLLLLMEKVARLGSVLMQTCTEGSIGDTDRSHGTSYRLSIGNLVIGHAALKKIRMEKSSVQFATGLP